MKFNCSILAQQFLEATHRQVWGRNKSLLARAAVSVALGQGVPAGFKPSDSQGVDLDENIILGTDWKVAVRNNLEKRAGRTLEEAAYRTEFRRHLEYGCQRLKELWEQSGLEQESYLAALFNLVDEDFVPSALLSVPTIPSLPVVEQAVQVSLLQEGEQWTINAAGQNALLIVDGKPGTGKSQLALDLLAQVARQGVRILFFDLKGELEDDPNNPRQRQNRQAFLELTGAQSVRLIRQGLPINPLVRDANPTVNAQVAYELAALIRSFAPQLGAKQERLIAEAFQKLEAPDFSSLSRQLEQMGATGVELALVKKILALNLFAGAQTGVSPEEWLSSSLVIDFKEFHNDNHTKALAVALILNFLMKRLDRNLPVKDGVQPLKMVLFVDEAHHLLPREGKVGVLGALARQGRSWGFPVWLASQDADAFLTNGSNATNFAELAGCGIHFSPGTLTEAQQRKILGGILRRQFKPGEAVLRLQGNLQTGMARQFWRDGGKLNYR